nr:NUDIX domain-containing protein [Micromonospora acroterricola]
MVKSQRLDVATGVVVHHNQVLFVRRIAPEVPEYHLKWELPGGKIESGEQRSDAVVREIQEETGYRVRFLEELPITYTADLALANPPLTVDVRCGLCSIVGDHGTASEPPQPSKSGTEEYRWLPFADIPYGDVIPGSREFVLWAANHFGQPIPPGASIYRVELESIDYQVNRRRAYELSLTFVPEKPEKPYRLDIRYGRVQSGSSRTKSSTYSSMSDALNEAKEKIATRKSHGYSLTSVESNHPLRSWMGRLGVPFEDPQYPKLFD